MSARAILIVWLAGIAILVLVVASMRGGLLFNWKWEDIPVARGDDPSRGAPAACEAASLLRFVDALAIDIDLPGNGNAVRADALADVLERQFPGQPRRTSSILGAQFVLDGVPYASLVTAQSLETSVEYAPAPAIILLFPESDPSAPLVLPVMGAGVPPETCPFDLRGWAVDTIRTVPFMALAAWTGGGLFVWLGLAVWRLLRRAR